MGNRSGFVNILLILTVLGLAFLISGTLFGKKFERTSVTPTKTGVGKFGPYCITREALDSILDGPVAFSCDGVDYILAAENVKIDRIYIHPEKKLAEKTTCKNVRYYSWYCHPPTYGSLWENTLWQAVPDANKPIADGDLFNIYIKKDPDPNAAFICKKSFPATTSISEALAKVAESEGEAGTINIGGNAASFNISGSAQPSDLEITPTRKKVMTTTVTNPNGSQKEYDVWVNLIKAFSPDEGTAYYLVEKGLLPESNNVTSPVPYRRYLVVLISTGSQGKKDSLQLETFRVIPTPDVPWWNVFLPESKPVLYLYPEEKINVTVKVKPLRGKITVSDPLYLSGGWRVVADINSSISYNNTTYPYLYYETEVAGYKIPSKGFVFKVNKIEAELKKIVERLGLSEHEIKEFVDYWIARFDGTVKTDYIFVGIISEEEMNRVVPLEINPKPETMIRVRLYFKEVKEPYVPAAPEFPEKKVRNGFTVVEWGGIL